MILTDDFENRNLVCVSILLSSIWDSDFHGFGNLGLKRGRDFQRRRSNGSAGGVGYGAIVDWRMAAIPVLPLRAGDGGSLFFLRPSGHAPQGTIDRV
ncbi:hypothetical protein TNCV_3099181 [Trichonephila clavipes]|nr:hypothetical protein TNCV_3099181 [Trichonephila clavipes]